MARSRVPIANGQHMAQAMTEHTLAGLPLLACKELGRRVVRPVLGPFQFELAFPGLDFGLLVGLFLHLVQINRCGSPFGRASDWLGGAGGSTRDRLGCMQTRRVNNEQRQYDKSTCREILVGTCALDLCTEPAI